MKISRYIASRPLPSSGSGVFANPNTFAMPGNALADLADTATGALNDLDRKMQETEAAEWVTSKTADGIRHWRQKLGEAKAAAPEGAPDFTPTFMADFADWRTEVLESAPNDIARDDARARFENLETRLFEDALGFEERARAVHRTRQFTTAFDNLVAVARENPADLPVLRRQALGDLAAAERNWMAPEAATDFRVAMPMNLAAAAMQGRIEKDPEGALADLKAGIDERTGQDEQVRWFDEKTRAALIGQAEGLLRDRAAELRAKRTEARERARRGLDEISQVLSAGFDPGDRALADVAAAVTEANDTGLTVRFATADAKIRTVRALGKLTPAEVERVIEERRAALEARGDVTAREAEVLGAAEGDLARRRADMRDDLTADLKALEDIVGTDAAPDARAIEDLAKRVSAYGDQGYAARLDAALAKIELRDRFGGGDPATLQSWINETRTAIGAGKPDSPAAVRELAAAEDLLSTMNRELARDPLSWAARMRTVPIQAIRFDDAESMRQRANAARAVSAHYGTPVKFLTDEETRQFTGTLASLGPDEKLKAFDQIQAGFGVDTPRVMDEIVKEAPLFVHAGGLSKFGAHQARTAREVLAGEQAMGEGNKVLPSPTDRAIWTADALGAATGMSSETRSVIIDAAEAIYTARALRLGLDPTDLGRAEDLWKEAISDAAGRGYAASGTATGGLGRWNGRPVILPPNVSEDVFEKVIHDAQDGELYSVSGRMPPIYADGTLLTARDLRDADLIAISAGRYIVDTDGDGQGNIAGDGPQGHFVLDFNAVADRVWRRQARQKGGASGSIPNRPHQ